jgi:hypothetical protein
MLMLTGLVLGLSLVGVQVAGSASSNRLSDEFTPAEMALLVREPALNTAAADAKSVAGRSYYAGLRVDDGANVVHLYLADAPQSVIGRLNSMHPGIYVIHNNAPDTFADLLRIQKPLLRYALVLRSRGIDITAVGPTVDGHLSVGIGNDQLVRAQSTLDPLVGADQLKIQNTHLLSSSELQALDDRVLLTRPRSMRDSRVGAKLVEVHHQPQATEEGYRFNDTPNWNAGDFIYYEGPAPQWTNCSSGIGVHDANHTYMLTAAHCFNPGQEVQNGYVETVLGKNNYLTYGSNTNIGTVTKDDFLFCDEPDFGLCTSTTDTALIQAPTGYDVFKSGWNSSEYATIAGYSENEVGDHVCTSGAFTGEACFLQISSLNQGLILCYDDQNQQFAPTNPCEAVYPAGSAANNNNSHLVSSGAGDSGGPVYYVDPNGVYTARGMIDGGEGGTVSCNQGITGYTRWSCYHTTWFIQMGAINSKWGVSPNHN